MMATPRAIVFVLAAVAVFAEPDASCKSKKDTKPPGVLLMQTKTGTLTKGSSSSSNPVDVGPVVDEIRTFKEEMAAMMTTLESKVGSCCNCSLANFNKSLIGEEAPKGLCAAFGDPHFITFDGAQTTFVGDKLMWLVKTNTIYIQALAVGSEGALKGFAAGGPFLDWHTVVVWKETNNASEPLHITFDGIPILQDAVGEYHFENPGVFDAYRRQSWNSDVFEDQILELRSHMQFAIGTFPERFTTLPKTGIYMLKLPGIDVTLSGVDWMSIVISMPAEAGQGGYCGDFNGSPDDDAVPIAPSWDLPDGPFQGDMPQAMSLFPEELGTALLGASAKEHAHTNEAEALAEKLRRVTECPPTLLAKAEAACNGMTASFHKFCIFDVCMTKDLAAARTAGAAAVLEHKVNARGIPMFMGHGRCLDKDGHGFVSFPTKLRTDTACQQVLRTLALTDGVMGAQLKRGGICEVLTAKDVDPTNLAIPGGWGVPDPPSEDVWNQIAALPVQHLTPQAEALHASSPIRGESSGIIADTTEDGSYNCWQLN